MEFSTAQKVFPVCLKLLKYSTFAGLVLLLPSGVAIFTVVMSLVCAGVGAFVSGKICHENGYFAPLIEKTWNLWNEISGSVKSFFGK